MARKRIANDGGLMIEGQGSVYIPPKPAVEECGSNPFGPNTPHPVRQIIEVWLTSNDRFSTGALYNLGRLHDYPKSHVRKIVQETWVGSDMELIKRGLIEIGLAKPRSQAEKLQEADQTSIQESEETAAQLLREAVVHLPDFEQNLRQRIEAYLARS